MSKRTHPDKRDDSLAGYLPEASIRPVWRSHVPRPDDAEAHSCPNWIPCSGTAAISNLIREAKTFQIPSLTQTGRNKGMLLLDDALVDLAKKKLVEPEEAYRKAIDKTGFLPQLNKVGISCKLPSEN